MDITKRPTDDDAYLHIDPENNTVTLHLDAEEMDLLFGRPNPKDAHSLRSNNPIFARMELHKSIVAEYERKLEALTTPSLEVGA